ncbi:MAG: hypothetical protein LBF80_02915 [Spirochaetaceae bacterium]|nr:hypothetical protein [Spirochaetaceae bacterium]
MKKRVFEAGMLAAALVFGLVLAGCGGGKMSPATDFEIEAEENGVVIVSYKGEGGAVFIPKTIDGKRVTAIDDYAFWGDASLTSVTIQG